MTGAAPRLGRGIGLLIGIGAAIGLAYLFSRAGVFLNDHGVTRAAIVAVFLMSGLTVSLRHLGGDLLRWRAHLLIQGLSLGLIPLVLYFSSGWLPDGPLRYGVYLVAVVPTTISSCVIYTTAAGGRTSSALINAVGGNLLGIVLSPLLLGLMIGRAGALGLGTVGHAVLGLCWMVLLPFVVGQILSVRASRLVGIVKRRQSWAAQGLVLLVIFCSFSKSVAGPGVELGPVWRCFVYLGAAHIVFVGVALSVGRLLRLPRDEAAAAVFCSTQKTLALAIPVALSFFPGDEVSTVLLPIIFYHLFQLTFGSVLIPLVSPRASQSRG